MVFSFAQQVFPNGTPSREECELRYIIASIDLLNAGTTESKRFFEGMLEGLQGIAKFSAIESAVLKDRAQTLYMKRTQHGFRTH